jgi:hypothetical protein
MAAQPHQSHDKRTVRMILKDELPFFWTLPWYTNAVLRPSYFMDEYGLMVGISICDSHVCSHFNRQLSTLLPDMRRIFSQGNTIMCSTRLFCVLITAFQISHNLLALTMWKNLGQPVH